MKLSRSDSWLRSIKEADFFMFLSTLSPFGGKRMTSIWGGRGIKNMIFHPDKRPVEVNDMFTYKLGYATQDIKKGDMVYITKSEGKYIKEFLEMFF